MTYEELRKLIENYAHRKDLRTDDLLDQFIDLAAIRIGRDVRMVELERTASLTVDKFTGLPFGYMSMRSVSIETPWGTRLLKAVSPADFEANSREDVERYCVRNGQLHIDGNAKVTINYSVRPAKLTTDASTNFVLETFPNLYLYAALMEVWTWAMDAEAFEFVAARFDSEADSTTALADRQRMGTTSGISRIDK